MADYLVESGLLFCKEYRRVLTAHDSLLQMYLLTGTMRRRGVPQGLSRKLHKPFKRPLVQLSTSNTHFQLCENDS